MKCDICGKKVKKAHEYVMNTETQKTKITSYRCVCGREPIVTKVSK